MNTLDQHPVICALKEKGATVEFDQALVIHHDLISNQIIRYKDIQKIAASDCVVPILVKATNLKGEAIAMVLTPTESDSLFAKGLYLVLTEPKGVLEALKNHTIATSIDHPDLLKAFEDLQNGDHSAGAIQRRLDQSSFKSYEELIELAQTRALGLKAWVEERLKSEEKAKAISQVILEWFLLKKLVYVHTMMNRTLLSTVCQNDQHLQRHHAKKQADAIQFVMFSQLWRM